jgi:hypothetical protein
VDHRRRRPAVVGDPLDVLAGENTQRDVPSAQRVGRGLLKEGQIRVAPGGDSTACLDVADEVVLPCMPIGRGARNDEVVVARRQPDVNQLSAPVA